MPSTDQRCLFAESVFATKAAALFVLSFVTGITLLPICSGLRHPCCTNSACKRKRRATLAALSMLGDCHAIRIERDVPGNSCDGWVRCLVGPYCVGAAVSEWFQIEVVGVALKGAIARMV